MVILLGSHLLVVYLSWVIPGHCNCPLKGFLLRVQLQLPIAAIVTTRGMTESSGFRFRI